MQKRSVNSTEKVASIVSAPIDYSRLNRGVAALGSLSMAGSDAVSAPSHLRENPTNNEVIFGAIALVALVGVGLWWSYPQRQMQQEYANTLRTYRKKIAESKGGEVPPMPDAPTSINVSQYSGRGFYN